VSRSHIRAWYSISRVLVLDFSAERRSAPFVVLVSHCIGVFPSPILVRVARAVLAGSDFRSRHQFTAIPARFLGSRLDPAPPVRFSSAQQVLGLGVSLARVGSLSGSRAERTDRGSAQEQMP
jgi:hypothetical protein